MNYSMIRYILFRLMRVMGCLFMLPFVVAIIYKEYDSAVAFLAIAAVVSILGVIGTHKKPSNKVIYAKEGFAITAVAVQCLYLTSS